jgi:diguanylate cyclase (GGDEF)-like protein/PAS domain S-box-containing protein
VVEEQEYGVNSTDRSAWLDNLTSKLDFTRYGKSDGEEELFLAMRSRTMLVVKTRWVLLLLLSIYGLYAGGFFYFSKYGFFLSSSQISLLIAAELGVIAYNYLLGNYFDRLQGFTGINQLQILLDILFATILVQVSGGAASWFWPVYLIITIEASFLLEQKRDVWFTVLLGTMMYAGVLAGNYSDLLPYVTMPFVIVELHRDLIYLVLMLCWVAILNVTVAFISSYLMSVIRRENQALRESEAQLGNFLDTANDLIFSISPAGEFLYVNHAWQRAMGYSLDDLANCSIIDVVHEESREQCQRELEKVLTGDHGGTLEKRLVSKDGRLITVEGNFTCGFRDDQPMAIWAICRDVTERRQAQEQLYHLAHHDALTGLPNRSLLLDRLGQAKALANRLKHQVAVLFLDLDRFKIINDTLGHEVGDRLLQDVAKRLGGCIREVDTVARIGGDEFIIVLVNIKTERDAEHIALKITKTLAKPYYIDSHELFITSSIGICFYPTDSADPDGLIKKADIAMYSAKGQGRNNFQFYAVGMDEHAEKILSLATSMRKALDRSEFRLWYQPKVDILTGRVTAMEALLRWQHPELGQLPPSEFIPLAEETGLIIQLGEWVMREACRQNKEWQDAGLPPIRVAVNLSGYQLQQKNILDVVRKTLTDTGLKSDYLEFEVTETVIMQNPDFATSVLKEFRNLGIHISIDDFGTGYSSLAHLKRFSVNTLKIDKTFVRDVEINSTDAAIATAIIAMGNSLNLKVIAEGVETEGQLSFLRENLCDEMQGYLFSKPLPSDQVVKFLSECEGKAWLVGGETSE